MEFCTFKGQVMITMKISPNYVNTKSISKRELWEETIKVWDFLVEGNYHPADFSCGVVTIYVEGFARLVSEAGGLASVKETNIYRSSSVWIGNIEVNFIEFKSNTTEGWTLAELWEPL